VAQVLASGHLVAGAQVQRLESLLATRLGGHVACAAVSSGTAALELALRAVGVEPGKVGEVIVPAIGFPAPLNIVERLGARPVVVDVRPDDWALDPQAVQRALTPRTLAIVGIDPFGASAPWPALEAIATQAGVALVEDAACALGAVEPSTGRPCGTFGDIACFSFHPRKIVTTGEGGAVLSRQPSLLARARAEANHGMRPGESLAERFSQIGANYRLSEVHAALGVEQMERLDELLQARRSVATAYATEWGDLPAKVLSALYWPQSAVQSFVCVLEPGIDRDRVIAELASLRIEATVASYAAHRLPYYAQKYGWPSQAFPVANAIFERGLTLPCYPGLCYEEVAWVCESLRRVFANIGA
jgi:dTDP-4-amino-4,6-dideoxygalactose transaminase